MKNKTYLLLIILILSCLFFQTMVYGAIASTMNVSGDALARIETNVRITNFKLYTINDAISHYETFHKNGVLSSITLPNASSYVIYKVEVTNYGNTNVGIYDIKGLPEGLTYELTEYKLKDKICNTAGACTSGIKKEMYLKISKTNTQTDFSLNLEFDFKVFHKITYENVIGTNLPTEIISTDPLSIQLNSYPKYLDIIMGEDYLGQNEYQYTSGSLYISSVVGDLNISKSTMIEQYDYTGGYQLFTAPTSGVYKLELWGASGGDSYLPNTDETRGGYGGYTSGEIALASGEKLYIYVGGSGVTCECHSTKTCCGENGGYNGGGKTYQFTGSNTWYGSGGGATDVRYFQTSPTEEDLIWNSYLGLNSRIMVAGGGSGASNWQRDYASGGYNFLGGGAGGLESNLSISLRNDRDNKCTVATQTAPGNGTYNGLSDFGQGGTPVNLYGPGGGGGYYGGGASETWSSGGSSYISGHTGCVAIESKNSRTAKSGCTTSNTNKNCSIHYTNLSFDNTTVIDGTSYKWTNTKQSQTNMPNPIKGTYTIGRGHRGNGYAKIHLLHQDVQEYTITYEGLQNSYQTSIIKGRDLILDLSNESIKELSISINDQETTNYTLENNILTINNVSGNIKIINVYGKYQNNLESYYPLTSTLNDESTTKRYGNLITQKEVTILYGDGLHVDGTGLRTESNNHTLPDKFTIMIDFYPTETDTNWHHIWGIWNGINTVTSYNSLSYNSYNFQIQNGLIKGEITTSPMKLNTWHRLVVTNDSTKWDLYLDGNFLTSAATATDKKTGYFYVGENIGYDGLDGEPSIVGYIKNLRIYNTPFTSNDIKLLGNTK